MADRSSLSRWNRALVTGASAGIGRAFAYRLADLGTDLVVVARDVERLESLAAELPVEVEVIGADLSQRAQLGVVEERLRSTELPIDLLINNAGFGHSGAFVDLDIESETSVVEVNVVALQRLAHAAGAAMADRGRGGILNVSSVAGYLSSPRGATYAATKAFVTSFSESLHMELGPQGVVVTCLCPGLTRTEFHERNIGRSPSGPDVVWQSAEAVAEAGLTALAAGKVCVVPGVHNKAVRGLAKALPGATVRSLTRLLDRQR